MWLKAVKLISYLSRWHSMVRYRCSNRCSRESTTGEDATGREKQTIWAFIKHRNFQSNKVRIFNIFIEWNI